MPAIPEWLSRLPGIIADFEALSTMVLDRDLFAHVFRVSRRQSIRLLHDFGARQTERGLAADRMDVLAQLRGMLADFEIEEKRKARLLADLEEARLRAPGRKVRIDVARYGPAVRERGMAGLPPTTRIAPGKLTIEYDSPADLVSQLMALAEAAAVDYTAFVASCSAPPANGNKAATNGQRAVETLTT